MNECYREDKMDKLQENIERAARILDDYCMNPDQYDKALIGNIVILFEEGQILLDQMFTEMDELFGKNPRDWEFQDKAVGYTEQGCLHIYENEADTYYSEWLKQPAEIENPYVRYGVSYKDFI